MDRVYLDGMLKYNPIKNISRLLFRLKRSDNPKQAIEVEIRALAWPKDSCHWVIFLRYKQYLCEK